MNITFLFLSYQELLNVYLDKILRSVLNLNFVLMILFSVLILFCSFESAKKITQFLDLLLSFEDKAVQALGSHVACTS